jgi:predicted nucleotide-binding protein
MLVPKGKDLKIPSDLLGLSEIRFDADSANTADGVSRAVKQLVGEITKKGAR